MENVDPAELLAARLREDLRRGEYHPRERLIESDLVARYGVPRATVRSSLLLLAAEGLIDRSPNRGASVRSLTIDEGIELAEVRRELEALCARDASERADPEERRRLGQAIEVLRYAVESDDLHTYRQSSIAFHEAVITMAHHESARRQLAAIRHHNLQRHFPAAFQGPWSESEIDHIAIGEAIIEGRASDAADAMHRHLSRVIEFLEDYRTTITPATLDKNVDNQVDKLSGGDLA